ncbi:hypothetical protein ACWDYH_17305 [Nocardia goodfellowii]
MPANFELLTRTMNGNLASSFFLAVVFGIAREPPQVLTAMNHLAQWATISPLKNQCVSVVVLPGILMSPNDVAANITNPLTPPLAREILDATACPGLRSAVPLAIINGEQDFWVPAAAPASCSTGNARSAPPRTTVARNADIRRNEKLCLTMRSTLTDKTPPTTGPTAWIWTICTSSAAAPRPSHPAG